MTVKCSIQFSFLLMMIFMIPAFILGGIFVASHSSTSNSLFNIWRCHFIYRRTDCDATKTLWKTAAGIII